MKTLEAVVPVYNEEAILPELHRRLTDTLSDLPYAWRVIYVDDGSRDRSPELLAGFADEDQRVGVVHLSRNFGQQLAISAGLAMTSADVVVLRPLPGLADPLVVFPGQRARIRFFQFDVEPYAARQVTLEDERPTLHGEVVFVPSAEPGRPTADALARTSLMLRWLGK